VTAELVAFLRARLDEDEQTARAVEDRSAPWDGRWVADGPDAARTFNGHVLFYGHSGPLKPGLVDHVVRHDPARVLAEVEAKRGVLRLVTKAQEDAEFPDHLVRRPARVTLLALEPVLQHLALAHADHADYREKWRP
jgi:hypothetical protein